jgi:hypothetical protein
LVLAVIALSENVAENKSAATKTLASENPPAFDARSDIPPSGLARSSLVRGGGSDVAVCQKWKHEMNVV